MNESFSDVWGEFVDLTYSDGAGDDDDPSLRWLVGEDVPGYIGWGFRSMKNPPRSSDPDRLGSANYVQPVSDPQESNDYGGVHSNNGINNKLCYLLTDGDTFNGQTVYGMGIPAVASLYWEVQANLLSSAADWAGLYNALRQAAVNLGWTTAERNNLYRACAAVEIASGARTIYVDKGNDCLSPNGSRTCTVGFGGPYTTVARGLNEAFPGDSLFIRAGSYSETVTFDKTMTIEAYDGPVFIGP